MNPLPVNLVSNLNFLIFLICEFCFYVNLLGVSAVRDRFSSVRPSSPMKRRSRSSPPAGRRQTTAPGTPRPYTDDLQRRLQQDRFPGASPLSTKFRKQLFDGPMVVTRHGATMQSSDSTSSSSAGAAGPAPSTEDHFTPPAAFDLPGNDIVEAPRSPARPRQPRARDTPDIAEVLTQQTAVLARMMEQLQARQEPARPQLQDPANPPEDPNFQWERLVLPSKTSFTAPSNGMVQKMATSLFARVPLLSERDQHEARFVLQVTSLWPDLSADERHWVFQRLNVYCIVAALGWPAATAACASSATTNEFVLPPGWCFRNKNVGPGRQNQQQPAAAAAAPAPAPQQAARQPRQRQRDQPRGGGGRGGRNNR